MVHTSLFAKKSLTEKKFSLICFIQYMFECITGSVVDTGVHAEQSTESLPSWSCCQGMLSEGHGSD